MLLEENSLSCEIFWCFIDEEFESRNSLWEMTSNTRSDSFKTCLFSHSFHFLHEIFQKKSNERHHTKRSLMPWVVVIPHVPIPLLVWQRLRTLRTFSRWRHPKWLCMFYNHFIFHVFSGMYDYSMATMGTSISCEYILYITWSGLRHPRRAMLEKKILRKFTKIKKKFHENIKKKIPNINVFFWLF